jgi:predicted Fe-Mo cluster-binding NifX family protein
LKLCITAYGNNLTADIDPRFGRCSYFIIVDPETLEMEAVENSAGRESGGAGIKAGQIVNGYGVNAVLTGNVGPNAFEVLSAAEIAVFTDISGTVQSAIEKYNNNELKPVSAATVESHAGVNTKT